MANELARRFWREVRPKLLEVFVDNVLAVTSVIQRDPVANLAHQLDTLIVLQHQGPLFFNQFGRGHATTPFASPSAAPRPAGLAPRNPCPDVDDHRVVGHGGAAGGGGRAPALPLLLVLMELMMVPPAGRRDKSAHTQVLAKAPAVTIGRTATVADPEIVDGLHLEPAFVLVGFDAIRLDCGVRYAVPGQPGLELLVAAGQVEQEVVPVLGVVIAPFFFASVQLRGPGDFGVPHVLEVRRHHVGEVVAGLLAPPGLPTQPAADAFTLETADLAG